MTPLPKDGTVMPLTLPLPKPQLEVSCVIGGQAAKVLYAGAAPGLVSGVFQVNVEVPQNASSDSAVPVSLTVGSFTSPAGVTVALR